MDARGMRPSSVEIQSNYTKRFEILTDAIYVGYATQGSAASAAEWQIRKFTLSSGNPTLMQWADGDESFDNVWDNRASLSYS